MAIFDYFKRPSNSTKCPMNENRTRETCPRPDASLEKAREERSRLIDQRIEARLDHVEQVLEVAAEKWKKRPKGEL